MISLIDSVINPVKSCMYNIWTQFPLAGIYCFELNDLHGIFYNKDGVFNGVILPDFHYVLSVGVHSIVLIILSIEYHMQ